MRRWSTIVTRREGKTIMQLEPYEVYTRANAIDVADGGVAICDAFFLGSRLGVCLADVSCVGCSFSMSTPRYIVWTPAIGTVTNADRMTIQRAMISPKFEVLLFILVGESRYMFIGRIDLGLIKPLKHGRIQFGFAVAPKLPKEHWRKFGSYSDWRLTINGEALSLEGSADLGAVLSEKWKSDVIDLELTRYEEDVMSVIANNGFACVRYIDAFKKTGLFSVNPRYEDDPRAKYVFSGYGGTDWEEDLNTVISKEEALNLMVSFFRSGTPDGLHLKLH
jgi:hypothetical protein